MTENSTTAKTIVITRPVGDETILRDELLALGYRVIHEPLTEIFLRHTAHLEVEQAILDVPDAVLITSKHAVQALAMLTELRDMFLLCVGEATANIATQLGFDRVSVAGGTVDGMVDYILDCYDEDSRFLYVSGEDVSVDLGEILGVRGMQVARVVVYDAVAAQSLSDVLVEQLRRGHIDALTFFSTRTANIFLSLAKKSGIFSTLEKIDVFCLSESIAEVFKIGDWQRIYSADKATLASIITCVDNAYRNNNFT
ncbi:MAG: uroporphyrinogen-III synthase [Rickettsiales bacterium]|jgi:uroporphyrinogen-III synthase